MVASGAMFALLAACAAPPALPPATDTGTPSAPGEATEWDPDVPSPEASLDAAAVEAAVTRAVAAVAAMDPSAIPAGWEAFLTTTDGACPTFYADYQTTYGFDYWYDDCVADSGASFRGSVLVDRSDPSYAGYLYTEADAEGLAPDGRAFAAHGRSILYEWSTTGESGTSSYAYHVISGAFAWPDGGWLEAGPSVDLSVWNVWTARADGGRGAEVAWDGGVAGLDGAGSAVLFDGVRILDGALGSECDAEPSGTVSVRDPASGAWYAVGFDGPPSGSTLAYVPACDGCGDVVYDGAAVGRACPDFAPMLAWEERPW